MEFRKALITGASSGIGEAVARQLATRGLALILAGRDAQRLEALAEELSSQAEVETFLGDLALEQDRQRLISIIHQNAPDLVINNAGLGLYGPALSHTTAAQMEIVHVNVTGLLELSLEAARTLITKHRPGVILNVSSVADSTIAPWFSVYCASKAFVTSLSQSLDFELRGHGVRVLAACPGVVTTRFMMRSGGSSGAFRNPLGVMTTEFAAREILNQVDAGKRVHAFNWRYRLIRFLCRYLFPTSWVAASMRKSIQAMAGDRPILTLNGKNE